MAARGLAAGGIILDFIRDVLRQAADEDVAEPVAARDGVVIERARGGDVPGLDVVGDDVHAPILALVPDVVERLLHVSHVNPFALRVNRLDEVGKVAVLNLAKQLLLAKVVQAKRVADTHEQSALEAAQRAGDAIEWSLVEKLDPAILSVPVQVDESTLAVSGRERQTDRGTHREEQLISLREVHVAAAQGRLVAGHLH